MGRKTAAVFAGLILAVGLGWWLSRRGPSPAETRPPTQAPENGQGESDSDASKVEGVRKFLALAKFAVRGFESRFGAWPPSSIARLAKFRDSSGERPFSGIAAADAVANEPTVSFLKAIGPTAADESGMGLTSGSLPCVVDPWGNPFVYLTSSEYEAGRVFRIRTEKGVRELVVRGAVDERGEFRNAGTYQLFSIGPDLRAGTSDDLGNW